MNGIILMSAFLAIVVALGGIAFLISRLLPSQHPLRLRIEATGLWIKENPRLFERRLKNVAFAILVMFFVIVTLVYS